MTLLHTPQQGHSEATTKATRVAYISERVNSRICDYNLVLYSIISSKDKSTQHLCRKQMSNLDHNIVLGLSKWPRLSGQGREVDHWVVPKGKQRSCSHEFVMRIPIDVGFGQGEPGVTNGRRGRLLHSCFKCSLDWRHNGANDVGPVRCRQG